MFLNNYWKIKRVLEMYPRLYNNNNSQTRGVQAGVKKTDGESANYITTGVSSGGATQSALLTWFGSVDNLLGAGISVKLATGDASISPDDYDIAGTDVSSSFTNLAISVTNSTENNGEVYICAITGVYNGSDPVEVERLGLVKSVGCQHVEWNNYATTIAFYYSVLLVEHELESPISLNNGDPLNIILKITQQ